MIADVLLDDARIEQIERQLRKEFPQLPESSALVSYVQEPLEVEHRGVLRTVECVVFGINTQNPRRPRREMLHKAAWPLARWREMESSRQRIVGYPDPALHAFRQLAPTVIDWYETMRDLNGPVEDFDDIPENVVMHG